MVSGSLARALSTAVAGAILCTAQGALAQVGGISLSVIEELAPVPDGQLRTKAHAADGQKWEGKLDLKGPSEVQTQRLQIQPGGFIGWHNHDGVLVVGVVSGAITLYDADDPTCTGRVVTAGNSFTEENFDVHSIRNEGAVPVELLITYLKPAGTPRAVFQPNPGHCPF